ncbi:sigma-E factor negative regulatory protein [Pseudomonas sp. Marseille-QA0892]
MSREALQETLSAVMDNEADELELRRVLAASGESEVRDTWARYQIARAAMHKDLLVPRLDLASAVSAAIAEEEAPVQVKRRPAGGLARIAVAASVTVAVLAGVSLYNQDDVGTQQLAAQSTQPAIEAPQVQGPAVLAGYKEGGAQPEVTEKSGSNWQEQRMPEYIRQHAQQSGADSALPFAREAGAENR